MKLIVGLGNPGIEYQFTPHNLGFLAVDRIAERIGARLTNRHCRALTSDVYNADEFVCRDPARLGPGALVILCSQTGTTRETVTNQLGRFRRLGYLKNGRQLVVNIERLSRFVETGRVDRQPARETTKGR